MDPETCRDCHEGHYKEWSGSMHAYAAEDPVFRAMNARGQEETDGELGDFCVSCHAPLAVQEGATTDGLNLEDVPKHLQGITCYFCHQVEEVAGTHNNPLVLANDTTMRASTPNPVKTPAHRSAYSRLHDGKGLESSPLCGSCHDIVVPGHFSGASEDVHLERTFAEWKESVFALPEPKLQAQSCNACHMRRTLGTTIASPPSSRVTMPADRTRHAHTFPGVDVALTDFPEREEQRQLIADFLEESIRLQLCWSPASGIRIQVDNIAAGHTVPSGASQDRRIWLDVKAYGPGSAEPAFTSGAVSPGVPATSLEPPAVILRDVAKKLDGSVAHMFWDVASYESNTVPVATPSNQGAHSRYFSFDLADTLGSLQPDRVTATVRVEPIGLDVLDDLIESQHLSASVRDAMPRFDVLPNRYSPPLPGEDPTVSLEWTFDRALDSERSSGRDGTYVCVESSKPRPDFVLPAP